MAMEPHSQLPFEPRARPVVILTHLGRFLRGFYPSIDGNFYILLCMPRQLIDISSILGILNLI